MPTTRVRRTQWPRLSGPIYTVGIALAIELLSRTALKVPNPPAFLLFAVVLAAFRGGIWSGLASAALAWGYFAYYFSIPHQPFHYTDENFRWVAVWLIIAPGIAWVVGIQRQRLDRLGEARRTTASVLESLLAASPGIVYRRLPETMAMTYVSGNVERILGYAPEEIVGVPRFWLERIHPDDRAGLQADNERAWQGHVPQTEREYRFRHKDGTYRWLHSVVQFEYAERGLANILGFVLDVTHRKQAEEAVRKANAEAERANTAKSEFLSRMSHELRTPLNAVLGFAQVLEMAPLTPAQGKQVGHIIKGGRHLLGLINEVLDISRIEAGHMALSIEVVAIRDTLVEAIDLIRPMADSNGIRIMDGAVRDCNLYLQADKQRFKQVLLNLLSNAVKYNRQDGQVIVAWDQRADGRVRLCIQDTGAGIPAAYLSRLFLPFERIGAEHSTVEGTGLGLALSAKLVEAMHGTIGVDSVEGLGSSFWVEFPTVNAPTIAPVRAQPNGVSGGPALSSHRRKVLYIEDNLSNIHLIEAILEGRNDIELVTAMQGQLGLDLAREHHPDLIFLDLHLPDVAGRDVLVRLKAESETKHIPVIVITADATIGQEQRVLALGARAFLTKPLDVPRLLALLDGVLEPKVRAGLGVEVAS